MLFLSTNWLGLLFDCSLVQLQLKEIKIQHSGLSRFIPFPHPLVLKLPLKVPLKRMPAVKTGMVQHLDLTFFVQHFWTFGPNRLQHSFSRQCYLTWNILLHGRPVNNVGRNPRWYLFLAVMLLLWTLQLQFRLRSFRTHTLGKHLHPQIISLVERLVLFDTGTSFKTLTFNRTLQS